MKILSCVIRLYFDNSFGDLHIRSKDLRGAIANLYPKEILLHHHLENGEEVYRYPLIQYKCMSSECLIIGLEDGAKIINNLNLIGKKVTFFCKEFRIIKKDILFQDLYYGINNIVQDYSFITPWLALNEKNYEAYMRLGNWAKKRGFLEKILIGNIISMSKSLGYTVPGPIEASIDNVNEVHTNLKGTPMLGFLGTFSVNFEIPDYWGIGKSVSRGFGTIKRTAEREEQINNVL